MSSANGATSTSRPPRADSRDRAGGNRGSQPARNGAATTVGAPAGVGGRLQLHVLGARDGVSYVTVGRRVIRVECRHAAH